MNADSFPDAIVGNANGFLKIFINDGESFLFSEDIPNVDLSGTSTPELGDLDGDGDLDLIVGESNGNVSYFERIDGENIEFSLISDSIISSSSTYTAPELIDMDGDLDLDLLIGTGFDGIKAYTNQGNLAFEENQDLYPRYTCLSL